MSDFYRTQMGQRFFEATMPQIARSLKEIAETLSVKSDSSGIEITEDAIYLRDDKGEIVSWTQKEWEEDPSVVVSIVNAVKLYAFFGPERLRHTIEAGKTF